MTAAAKLEVAHVFGHEHVDAGETVTVTLSFADAIAIGQQLRAQARHPKTPHGAREIMARVGQQMCSAASLRRVQIAAEKTDRSADVVDRLNTMGGDR